MDLAELLTESYRALPSFQNAVSAQPLLPENWYALGVIYVDCGWKVKDPTALEKSEAALLQAITLNPEDARFHAMLGYVLFKATRYREAMTAFGHAHQLDPLNALFETFWITLLAELVPENEALIHIEEAAERQGCDLESIRQAIRATTFPLTLPNLVGNAFFRPDVRFESYLSDEVDRLLERVNPGRSKKIVTAEEKECKKRQRELKKLVTVEIVPDNLTNLVPFAQQIGIGDDGLREIAISHLSERKRRNIIQQVDLQAKTIDAWLDNFDAEVMPPEAAAFLYLLSAVEEMRD